jgi:hypothetical protein
MADEEVAYLPAQWLFTNEEINNSPSILDGVAPIEERCRRAKGVNFLVQAGILLKIPQLTLATASVFFHRFYMRYSMEPGERGIHHYVGPPLPINFLCPRALNPSTRTETRVDC